MLSVRLSRVISKIRATYFTARMPVPLQFLGHEIVYFGILKYHSVHEKPGNGILSLKWDSGDMWPPTSPIPFHRVADTLDVGRLDRPWGVALSGIGWCCSACVTQAEVFHRCLTPPFSLYGPNLGRWVLGCYPQVNILPIYSQTCS